MKITICKQVDGVYFPFFETNSGAIGMPSTGDFVELWEEDVGYRYEVVKSIRSYTAGKGWAMLLYCQNETAL